MHKLNPFVRVAKKIYTLKPQHKCSICYDSRIFYIKNSRGDIVIEDKKYDISNNTAIFIPPGTQYRFYFEDWNNIEVIVINFDLTDKYSHFENYIKIASEEDFDSNKLCVAGNFDSFKNVIVSKNPEQIENTLLKCCEEFLAMDNYYRERSSALLKICLLAFIDETLVRGTNAAIVKSITDYIYNNFGDASLTNEKIAQHFGYHPYYLSDVVKVHTGKTLRRYVLDYRIHIAQNMLITTNESVENIAWKTGFNSASHFISTFKKGVGMTPLQYRHLKGITYF